MSYSDVFRARMNSLGNSKYDRMLKAKTRSFEKWFNDSLTKELVTIDGVKQYAVIQDQNQSNNKDLSDDKYVIVKNDSNIQVGSYIRWRGLIWMVFSEEVKTIPTHKQVKIKQSNHLIRWRMSNGKISGNGNGYPAYVQNQTLYTLGVSTSGNHSWIINAKMMMYMQNNEETRSIDIGQRIFIGNDVYKVMFRDTVSRQGLINYLLEEDFVNKNTDNVELGIANYYDSDGKNPDTTQEPIENESEIVLQGSDKAKIGSIVKYDAHIYQNGVETTGNITEWTISDTESVATIVEQTPNSITIRIESNFQKVGSVITIIGKTADGSIGSKSVKIISPY